MLFGAVVVVVFFFVRTAMQVGAVGVAAFKAVVVARQAVAGGLAGVGGAQVTPVAHPRQAHAAGVGAVKAARHFAGGLAIGRPAFAHPVVARVARHAFYVHGQVASAAGQRERPCPLARAGVGAQLSAALNALLRDGGGYLAVEHVDHATYGAAAIHQRRGAAQHFDLRGQQGLGRHGVVGADGGGVVQLGAIRQHLDAGAIHAANDGAAGTGAEVAAGDAGLAAQCFAQRGLAAAYEFVALQHGGGRGHFIGAQLQAAGRHGDGGQAACGWWCCLRIGLCMRQTGAPQREDGGQGHRVQGWVAMCSAIGWAKGVRVVCHDCVAIEIGGRAGRHAAFRPGGRKPSKI